MQRSSGNLRIAFAAGRFNGPTLEHHRLISLALAQPADKHYIFVLGPERGDDTTLKNPFTVDEKLHRLRTLYPDHQHVFISGATNHTRTLNQCLAYVWHLHKEDFPTPELIVLGGRGMSGITRTTNEGASINTFESMLHRLNGSRFPAGDYRMNYGKITLVPNRRGKHSWTFVRNYVMNQENISNRVFQRLKRMLHPNMSTIEILNIYERIRNKGTDV